MSSFCTAKATHIFLAKKFSISSDTLDVNFNESLTNDIVSFEQLGPGDFLLFWLQTAIEPFGLFPDSVYDYMWFIVTVHR